jgi:hypothetical protein
MVGSLLLSAAAAGNLSATGRNSSGERLHPYR